MTPREVTTPQPSMRTTTTIAAERDLIENSMTPPLSIRATSVPGEDDLLEDGKNDDATATANATKVVAPKKNEWDMFAEQDLESNFDVS